MPRVCLLACWLCGPCITTRQSLDRTRLGHIQAVLRAGAHAAYHWGGSRVGGRLLVCHLLAAGAAEASAGWGALAADPVNSVQV